MMLRRLLLPAIAAAFVAAAAAVPASGQSAVESGALRCHSPGAVGFVVGAVLDFDCVFLPSYGARPQPYVGVVRRIGLDLGVTNNVSMAWAVFSPTRFVHPGDLAGSYGGVQAGATVGVGGSANALVGGSNNAFALQPLSGQAQTGLSVAAGLADFELRPAGAYLGPGPGPFRHRRHHH